jgi:hypothetical protein
MDDDSSELIQQLLIEIRSNSEGQEAVKVILIHDVTSVLSEYTRKPQRMPASVFIATLTYINVAGCGAVDGKHSVRSKQRQV